MILSLTVQTTLLLRHGSDRTWLKFQYLLGLTNEKRNWAGFSSELGIR